MFDSSLLFFDNQVISTEAETAYLEINKTPANGIGIEVACSATTSSTGTLDVVVKAGDTTGAVVTVAQFAQITSAGGVRYLVVQTKRKYLALVATPAGTTPGFTIKAGIVSGPPSSDGFVSQ